MLECYDPWGKPGNGAPIPGHLRKTKLLLDENPVVEQEPASVLNMGRPGHGAPLRTKSGRTKTYLKADPLLRFQFHEPSRKAVDNDLRYKASPQDQENYRKQLDAIVSHKRGEYERQSSSCKQAKCRAAKERNWESQWGRPCPGGQLWRHPGQLGHNFLKSLGYSNDVILNQLGRKSPHEQEQIFEISEGIELVPLLAKNRSAHRCPLSTTDVTRLSKVPNGPPRPSVPEESYLKELSNQVTLRQHLHQAAQKEDIENSVKHFQTWKGFWGRPGHGAPKGMNHSKEKLDVILYEVPAARNPMQGVIH